jgi:hypothetical protein
MAAEGSQKPQQGATGSQGLKRRRRCAELQGAKTKTVDVGPWYWGPGAGIEHRVEFELEAEVGGKT